MNDTHFVSPNEILEKAKAEMIDGRDPVTTKDWALVMNYMAFNVHADVAESACLLLRLIYDMPLTEDEVKQIVAYQQERR
jgi:hypothetical protein